LPPSCGRARFALRIRATTMTTSTMRTARTMAPTVTPTINASLDKRSSLLLVLTATVAVVVVAAAVVVVVGLLVVDVARSLYCSNAVELDSGVSKAAWVTTNPLTTVGPSIT
jgi:hypothetical protein